jgi:hypothetical protein
LLKLFNVVEEEGMVDHGCECHSFFGIYNEQFLEEIFKIVGDFFLFLFLGDYSMEIECRVTSATDVSF